MVVALPILHTHKRWCHCQNYRMVFPLYWLMHVMIFLQNSTNKYYWYEQIKLIWTLLLINTNVLMFTLSKQTYEKQFGTSLDNFCVIYNIISARRLSGSGLSADLSGMTVRYVGTSAQGLLVNEVWNSLLVRFCLWYKMWFLIKIVLWFYCFLTTHNLYWPSLSK